MSRAYQDILEESKKRIIQVYIRAVDLPKYENGEIVQGFSTSMVRDKAYGLTLIDIRASQCHAHFRNGKPYIQKADWTWEQIESFNPMSVK